MKGMINLTDIEVVGYESGYQCGPLTIAGIERYDERWTASCRDELEQRIRTLRPGARVTVTFNPRMPTYRDGLSRRDWLHTVGRAVTFVGPVSTGDCPFGECMISITCHIITYPPPRYVGKTCLRRRPQPSNSSPSACYSPHCPHLPASCPSPPPPLAT